MSSTHIQQQGNYDPYCPHGLFLIFLFNSFFSLLLQNKNFQLINKDFRNLGSLVRIYRFKSEDISLPATGWDTVSPVSLSHLCIFRLETIGLAKHPAFPNIQTCKMRVETPHLSRGTRWGEKVKAQCYRLGHMVKALIFLGGNSFI